MTQATAIRCSCGTLFGYEQDGVLNIKHRDLYRHVEGGIVTGPCRKCGKIVRWPISYIEKGS